MSLLLASFIDTFVLEANQDFVYVDNIGASHETFDGLFKKYVALLDRARVMNLVYKVSDLVIGYSTDDGPFQVLGYQIQNGKLEIPPQKLASLASCMVQKSRKAVLKLIGNLSFYGQFSTGFAEGHYRL